ncbi:MAG: hypothetical protein CO108_22235 [Deltaproteobacteria bacterium CG_4_9_14_3_um_filter_63_12]|nr:MAG: hypothetical protein CO108_22235 [Deltaproteobacteria bacterium CG_4_9_14_3_um_filter_63_12]
MKLLIPDFCVVVLIGATGAGKSTFAARHFLPTEVLSSDNFRAMLASDANEQSVTAEAFELLHQVLGGRLAARRLCVVDATNLKSQDRAHFVQIARRYHALPVALVLDTPEAVCIARTEARPDRSFGASVVRSHRRELLRTDPKRLKTEGFRRVFVLDSVGDLDAAVVEREPLWNDRRQARGPFDIVGDVHGCFAELRALLDKLGYVVSEPDGHYEVVHPAGRRLIFLGDLVDRGPQSDEVLRFVMDVVEHSGALNIIGNHEVKLGKVLDGRKVVLKHGLDRTVEQLERTSEAFRDRVRDYLRDLISHYVLDGGDLVVAHAGLKASMHGRDSAAVRSFCIYGETNGEVDELGLPIRGDWANRYQGRATVVYGHTPMLEAEWFNNTICVDTGCVFGGKLTALRYPERTLVQVDAQKVWFEPPRPLERRPRPDSDRLALDGLIGASLENH